MKKFFWLFAAAVLFAGCAALDSLVTSQGNSDEKKSSASSADTSPKSGAGEKNARPAAVPKNISQKTNAELVAEAVRSGDCAFLYAYTQKANADKTLITQANNAIKRYTGIDSSTPKYRTDKMDFRVRRVPKELMEKVFVDPKNTLSAVVSSLVSGVTDQFLKAKILHDWICDNIAYDTSMYFSGRISAQDYVSVLKKKKAVCSGYANLFEKMCEAAGIEAIVINGYSKGFGYTGKIGKNTDHAWNAVYIGSKWYLIDVTWDAGHLDRRTFIKEFSTQWLFLDPRPFLYSHLPQTDAHQFYAPVLTAEDFMREAYIAGSFFHYGLALKSDLPEYNNTIDGEFNFDIIMRNSNVSLTSQTRTAQQQNVDAASWTERKGSAATISFDVPDNAAYKGHIFAKLQNEERLQTKIGIGTFEQEWLQKAEALFAEKKITGKELAYFKNSYFRVAEN
jgi:transglutaminase/protease-like cytokinesis protein 3